MAKENIVENLKKLFKERKGSIISNMECNQIEYIYHNNVADKFDMQWV